MNGNTDHRWTLFMRSMFRSILAVFLGLAGIMLLSAGPSSLGRTAGVLHRENFAAVLAYRSACTVFGGYIAARFAPSRPVGHALVLGGIECLLVSLTVTWSMSMQFFGAAWYHYGLAVIALPSAWAGGALYRRFGL